MKYNQFGSFVIIPVLQIVYLTYTAGCNGPIETTVKSAVYMITCIETHLLGLYLSKDIMMEFHDVSMRGYKYIYMLNETIIRKYFLTIKYWTCVEGYVYNWIKQTPGDKWSLYLLIRDNTAVV